MKVATVKDLTDSQISGKRVFVRVDFNVPLLKDLSISDDTRISSSIPTIEYLIKKDAKVILCSHLGRPDGKIVENLRMKPVVDCLTSMLKQKGFTGAVIGLNEAVGPSVVDQISSLRSGDIAVLENIRFYEGEEANDPKFAKELAKFTDVYVNDAFGTAHRAHASTAGLPRIVSTKVSGLLMSRELEYLQGAILNPKRPLTAVIGGAKVSTKIGVLESLLNTVDQLILGGGMIFTFYKAKGLDIGNSLLEEGSISYAKELQSKASDKGVEFILPVDVVVADRFDNEAATQVVSIDSIPSGWAGLDIGPASVELFKSKIGHSKTVLWNGPLGVFELPNFAHGTYALAAEVGRLTMANKLVSIVGGGDSVAAMEQFNLSDQMSHISTGGGASLELLEKGTLPGVEALVSKN